MIDHINQQKGKKAETFQVELTEIPSPRNSESEASHTKLWEDDRESSTKGTRRQAWAVQASRTRDHRPSAKPGPRQRR